jgi:DNA-binding NtrC family response regulator
VTRCLIIEDDLASRRVTATAVTHKGLEVRGMNHPVFSQKEDSEDWADIILLDMSPPNQDLMDLGLSFRLFLPEVRLAVPVTSTGGG